LQNREAAAHAKTYRLHQLHGFVLYFSKALVRLLIWRQRHTGDHLNMIWPNFPYSKNPKNSFCVFCVNMQAYCPLVNLFFFLGMLLLPIISIISSQFSRKDFHLRFINKHFHPTKKQEKCVQQNDK